MSFSLLAETFYNGTVFIVFPKLLKISLKLTSALLGKKKKKSNTLLGIPSTSLPTGFWALPLQVQRPTVVAGSIREAQGDPGPQWTQACGTPRPAEATELRADTGFRQPLGPGSRHPPAPATAHGPRS